MTTKFNPFDDLVLDEEEQAIEDAIERDEYVDAPDFEKTKKILQEAARRYTKLNTSKPITIRIKQTDLIKIKAKARKSEIPYQTLIGAVLHDFAEGNKTLVIK